MARALIDYLVCYDISDDRARTRVARLLGEEGSRVQESVFEVSVESPASLETLLDEVEALIDEERGAVRAYRVCARCRAASFTGEDTAAFFRPAHRIV